MNIVENAKNVFDKEIEALKVTKEALNDTFVKILECVINCKGKVVITGVGKPGHIASKIAATFSSLGTPSFYLHADEAMHGDLGMVSSNDVVIAISYSGESEEIVKILSVVKYIGAKLIGITGNKNSLLAKECDIVQVLPHFDEACHFGFAPTSSTTVELCYGDALAVVASQIYGFSENDYGRIHPAGTLGKKSRLRVLDVMVSGEYDAKIYLGASMKDVIVELSKKKLGIVNVFNNDDSFAGIITGGDIYRALEKGCDIYNSEIDKLVTKTPITISVDKLAIDALNLMKQHNIMSIPVVDKGTVMGTVVMRDLFIFGIV